MARRGGFERALMAAGREVSRQARLAEQNRKRALRESAAEERRFLQEEARQLRLEQVSAREAERERKAAYLEGRLQKVDELNAEVSSALDELENVLSHTLSVNDAIDFDSLRIKEKFKAPSLSAELLNAIDEPNSQSYLAKIKRPNAIAQALLPWVKKKYETAISQALAVAASDAQSWRISEASRVERLADARSKIEKQHFDFDQKVAMRNAEVDAFRDDYHAGDADALVAYISMVLERSEYPTGIPQTFSVAYQTQSKQIVIEYQLPSVAVVPGAETYRYNKTRDEIDEKARKPAEVKAIYADLIASVALRTIHEVFESDIAGHVDSVCFNGFVNAIDPATGRDISPHLISVRTTRDVFLQIDLSRANKAACLRNLGAQVSRNPEDIQPVKPIVDFKMADARFIDQADLASTLSDAVNLMDLTPPEFEVLVANLFGKMGLESKLTRSSRDGGVDCIAYDPRPVLGGKVVIQAKRYRHTVGVSAVRDLYGTMMNEGASKGLLVATSGYGPDAFNFARDKPIELIDGGGLLYLLQDIGVTARIVMPTE